MTATVFYRAHRPAWSHAPLSGQGAALNGGRWNRKGQVCLYLAGDPATALAEYRQDFEFRPTTLVGYHLQNACLADLRDPDERARLAIPQSALSIDWYHVAMTGGEPDGWPIATALISDGYHGLLYHSRLNGGTCLALWRWNAPDAPDLAVQDLHGDLPRDNRSWS